MPRESDKQFPLYPRHSSGLRLALLPQATCSTAPQAAARLLTPGDGLAQWQCRAAAPWLLHDLRMADGEEGWGLNLRIGRSKDQYVWGAPDSMPSEALSKPDFTHL